VARHIYHCPLRWSDMDVFGHINNVAFVRYLEEARIDLMFRLGAADGAASFSNGSVVARHEIDYVRPLVHRPEPVVIESWVTDMSAASVTIAYDIKDGDVTSGAAAAGDAGTGAAAGTGGVYARARTVVVPYDLQAQRPRRITVEERAFLDRFRDDDPSGPVARERPGGPGDESEALVV
jgi:acyl-CoA thioester hydrolase